MFFGYLGETAAFLTALAWALSSQFHASATRMIGVPSVTLMRVPYNIALLLCVFFLVRPANVVNGEIIFYLALSAFFGIALCDTTFYKAINIIGPRLACLVQSLSACITAVLGYLILGETIGLVGALGIGVAIFGVFFVLAEGGNLTVTHQGTASRKELLHGAGMAFFSAIMLALSMIFLKEALLRGTSPLFAAIMRLVFGGFTLFIFYGARRNLKNVWGNFINTPASWKFMLIGGFFGTSGIWMSGVAMGNTEAGVAATIIALEPILIVPINAVYEKKTPSHRAILGTLIAFIGIAVLIMR